ncbi:MULTISPECIES: alpha/beta fold hydrolase [Asticcacaulis]|uniref:alpha/beta fold hydrolase n=1 Tax=Asticcacaulis TaxID=76890 RepID=UPI001AEBA5B8|nr:MULTISPECIES: alpha/beta hydrolase [Asticcacaulis]MBP2158723.1 pimeloyl-ACP methyl ester carboxylesterase [Asticcacaulis solisilvae]MDR6799769.1 pimeloyl-ACP methyl ester carboxylesterase [Asticcacaulis sp. BE141]
MLKSILPFGFAALFMAAAVTTPAIAAPAEATQAAVKAGYKQINGINYYYEIHGQGEPLLLLHGGLGSIDMFDPILPLLTQSRQVIAVDLQGHGRTALGDRAINPADIGRDMAELTKALGYKQVDVLGYSFGGMTAVNMAAHAPQSVRRLVVVSAPFSREGFFAEMLPQQAQVSAAMAPFMKDTPMYTTYAAVAPRPEDFPKLLDAMGAMMREPYDYTPAVRALNMPVMLIYGDSDMVRPEHVVDFYKMLGGGLMDAGWQREHMAKNRLAIVPDLTHYEMFLAPQVFTTAMPFLNGESGAKSWAGAVTK